MSNIHHGNFIPPGQMRNGWTEDEERAYLGHINQPNNGNERGNCVIPVGSTDKARITKSWARPFIWFLLAIIGTLTLCLVFCARANGEEIPTSPGEWITCEVTAYCGGPCARCQTTGRTANGTRTNRVPYAVAADQSLPMGSRLFIPAGLGYLDRLRPSDRIFTVDDRGGALDTEALRSGIFRIDLRFKSHLDAQRFGRKFVSVFLFSPTHN